MGVRSLEVQITKPLEVDERVRTDSKKETMGFPNFDNFGY